MPTRYIAAMLALVVLASLAGCGKKGPLEDPVHPRHQKSKPASGSQ